MNFNVDDPLAGILSDGSDDSFFDDDILGKRKPTKKKSPSLTDKKSAVFDLGNDNDKKESVFDLGDTNKKKNDETTKIEKPNTLSPALFKRTTSKESIKIQTSELNAKQVSKSPAKPKVNINSDKTDIFSEHNIVPKKEAGKPLERGKSSQSLLDDILGAPLTKTKDLGQSSRSIAAGKNQDFDLDTFIGKSDSKQILTSNKNISYNTEPKKDSAQPEKISEDWLGIFQDKDDDNNEENDSGMPPWLSGGNTKKKKVTVKKKEEVKQPIIIDQTKEKHDNETDQIEIEKGEQKQYLAQNMEQLIKAAVPSSNILQGGNEDIAAEGAALYLQQQESQLMVALQLKAQEERLAALQMRQKESLRVQREAAKAQHTQLDTMLRKQAEQRQQMQAVITEHQERITQRIKALLDTSTRDNDEDIINTNAVDEYENITNEKKETPFMKEKKQLLQLVQSLQENHDKEIDLMETSYRRQLAFLEVSINQAEERMKEESDKLVRFYTEKIHWLEEHHQLFKKLAEDNLISLTERHKAENEMLRHQHLENVRILQEHHVALMENIKNAVKQEQVLIRDAASFSSELHELVIDVKENKSQCQQLVETVQSLAENMKGDTEKNWQVKETQINDMIQQLKKEREHFDIEKTETRDMVRMLETRLKQMTSTIEEDTAALKQRKMEFEFERATFNKQTEFAKNVLKKQDEENKMLKEDIQREYQDKILKLEEEKARALKDNTLIAKEKASVQSLKQELEKMKAELQAQLEEVIEERSKLNVEKQQLQMEEQRAVAKSRDLDLLAKAAIEKQSQSDKKYSEAEIMQKKYEERIRRIQEHVVSLNSREKQIAREKVALSRERLSLHNERKQMESRQQCSLCKSTQNVPQYHFDPTYTLPEMLLNPPVSRNYGDINVNTAMNAIEQEMAHFMGRSFSLRHSTGVGRKSNYDEIPIEDKNGLEDFRQSAPQSATLKDYLDPKFMMLRMDVQQVISNLDQSKKEEHDIVENESGNN